MTNSFFSSKHSALALGLTLGVSALFAWVTYAQNLQINTNGLANNRITIKEIYLSPTGSASSAVLGASIVLDGVNQTLTLWSGTSPKITLDGKNGRLSTANVVTDYIEVTTSAEIQHANIDSAQIWTGEIMESLRLKKDGERCRRLVERQRETWGSESIRPPLDKNCLLFITQRGEVNVTTDLSPWLDDTTNSDVFKRNSNGNTNGFFANRQGQPSTVSRGNYLTVGLPNVNNESNDAVEKDDIWLLVAGSAEIRGGTLIKKIDGMDANQGSNTNTNISKWYTALDTKVNAGNIYFQSERKNSAGTNHLSTNFLFSAQGASTKVGINTTRPQYDLDVNGTSRVTTSLSVQGVNDDVVIFPGELEPVLGGRGAATESNGRLREPAYIEPGIDDVVIDPCSLNPRDCIIPIDPCGFRGCDDTLRLPFFDVDGTSNVVNIRKNTMMRNQNVLNVYGDTTLQGTVKATSYLAVGYPSTFRPSSTDKLFVNGSTRANAYYYNSDSRYKANIATLSSSLDKIVSLNGYSYFNKLSEKNDIGVIAQEVEKVFPELVQTDTEGYKSVSYGNLVAPLIEAVKELSHKIDELFNKYADQQSQIDALEARIQALEQAK